MSDYSHILAAIDFAESSSLILDKAKDIALRNNAKLSLIHVVEYLPPLDSAYEPILVSNWAIDEKELLERGQHSLEHISKTFKLDEIKNDVELRAQLGIPKNEICDYAREQNCDLIVMGSHGRHGIKLLLGSTANAVLHEMPCDILAVKIEDKT